MDQFSKVPQTALNYGPGSGGLAQWEEFTVNVVSLIYYCYCVQSE